MKKETGGPAFPVQESSVLNGGERAIYPDPGMTLRDYFAAKAMQAEITLQISAERYKEVSDDSADEDITSYELMAEKAYRSADAMLRAREL